MPINFKKLNILVVEDLKPMRELMVAVLRDLGVGHVSTASDGEEGFRALRTHNPDILITDWEMAPVNGLELTRRVRLSPMSPNRLLPVIIMTGYTSPHRVTSARDAGITEFLAKPFTAETLVQRITHIINKPRDVIEAPKFFGPDRRRREDSSYQGPKRRKRDEDPSSRR
jgi:two-component system chemotaxis response regulator CheY